MKAVTLIVELKRERHLCEDDIAFLKGKMPAYAEQVIHSPRMIAFLMPAHDILPAMRAPLHNALSVFENYWFLGLSGEALAKNGGLDPVASALKQYVVPAVAKPRRAA